MTRKELEEKLYQLMSPSFGGLISETPHVSEIMDLIDEYTKPKKKTKSLEERKIEFKSKLVKIAYEEGSYNNEFFEYWTEHNEGGKKMRFEMAKNQPFNINRRLATLKRNQKNYNNGTTTKQTRIDAFKDVYKSGEL